MEPSLETKHIFSVPNYGRSASDEAWERIEPQYISTWDDAVSLLSSWIVKLQKGTCSIQIDWSPIPRKHRKFVEVMEKLQKPRGSENLNAILSEFPQEVAKIKIAAKTTQVGTHSKNAHIAEYSALSFLHDAFLILNLSAPGCCDFYRASLQTENTSSDISMSNFYFEISLLRSFDQDWPQLTMLRLDQTIPWFKTVRSNAEQIPQNPMEKALFALLHISRLEMTPIVVIWIFYALESLLQTKVGENFSSMINRLCLLLELNERQIKVLRKNFRALYDIRSSLVHGGFEVSHPLHNEQMDDRLNKNYDRWSDAAEYGCTLLIAAIQKSILLGWQYPVFVERLEGTSASERPT